MPAKMIRVIAAKMVFILLFFSALAYGDEKAQGGRWQDKPTSSILNDIKKTVVFIGTVDENKRPHFYATGFLMQVQGIYHLLTAKHIVMDKTTGRLKDYNAYVFFNSRDGKVTARPIEETKQKFDLTWIFHTNPEVDIAVIPFPLSEQQDDVRVMADDLFTASDKIFELYDVFFLSYQPGVEPKTKISPIFRSGVISAINEDRTFYIDAFAFPGNSGSPVFLKPSLIRFEKKDILVGGDPLGGTFIGITGEYIPYQELAVSAQTGRPRVIFEENTGLSKVWSVEFIREIINSDVFNKQLNRIKGRINKK